MSGDWNLDIPDPAVWTPTDGTSRELREALLLSQDARTVICRDHPATDQAKTLILFDTMPLTLDHPPYLAVQITRNQSLHRFTLTADEAETLPLACKALTARGAALLDLYHHGALAIGDPTTRDILTATAASGDRFEVLGNRNGSDQDVVAVHLRERYRPGRGHRHLIQYERYDEAAGGIVLRERTFASEAAAHDALWDSTRLSADPQPSAHPAAPAPQRAPRPRQR